MSLFRYRIKPQSAFATPLRSDTLYGHLLWRAAEKYGSGYVTEMIGQFAGEEPPFVVSSAVPADCLPMPQLPPIKRARFREQFAPTGGSQLVGALQKYKLFRKQSVIAMDKIQALADNLSQEALFRAWLADPDNFAPAAKSKQIQHPHNSIDRNSGKVTEQGGLFFSPENWYAQDTELDLYVKTDRRELFEDLFSALCQSGYGADSSIGKGQFTFTLDTEFTSENWPTQSNAELLLSLTAAPTLEGFTGYYQPQIKRGKAWSGFGERNPFKKPFMALTEGSVLTSKPTSGYLLRNIHSNPDLVQVTWPLTLPLQLEVES